MPVLIYFKARGGVRQRQWWRERRDSINPQPSSGPDKTDDEQEPDTPHEDETVVTSAGPNTQTDEIAPNPEVEGADGIEEEGAHDAEEEGASNVERPTLRDNKPLCRYRYYGIISSNDKN